MKYLIYETYAQQAERNFEARARISFGKWLARTDHDSPYQFTSIVHPDTGECAMCISDDQATEEAGILSLEEIGLLENELDPTWTPEPEEVI